MARGVNKVLIVGNTTGDPEVRYQTNGNAVTNITVATNESWKDKNTGQMQERAEFHRIVFFNKLAEIAGEYLRKGSKVYVEGALRTRKWQDQSGQDRYTTEIVASEMQMLDSRSDNGGAQKQPQQGYQQATQQQQRPAPQHQRSPNEEVPHSSQYQGGGNPPAPGFDDFDVDIPFMNPYKFYEMVV